MEIEKDQFLQLKHKKRNITDLARHLKNRTDEESNYILFLGAGASVTSGIRTGNKLVELWKKEIYEGEKNNDSDYLKEDIEEWVKKQIQWYDENNAYSSLFEKRFDLPAQRRNFIESEVINKTPFIGYAYLVKLVNNGFINTIMTTNFDDLLNEAFYHYGGKNNRPILCAHDSTISSININSKRPKLIKLHGDYLYDNIKSSLRETESLETNIKNKFIEFSKNKGLIVIGYSGCDRSIMDTLNFLLSNEEYLKHGVYWCIRKGDKISLNLKKLLWKDKVYFIEIEGFDELMSELNFKINDKQLPIEPYVTMDNYNFLIKHIIDNNSSNCEFIRNDINRLKQQNESRVYKEFFETLRGDEVDSRKKNSKDKLTNEEEIFLLQEKKKIQNFDEKIIKEVINNCNKKIDDSISLDFQIELLEFISICFEIIEENESALNTIKKLEELSEDKIKYFQKKLKLMNKFEDKISECSKAITENKYNYIPYTQKAKIKINYYENTEEIISNYEKDDIEKNLCKSIELNPTKYNMSHYIYIDFILNHKKLPVTSNSLKGGDKVSEGQHINKAREIYNNVECQDPNDSEVIEAAIKIMRERKKNPIEIANFIRKRIDDATTEQKKEIYLILFNYYLDKEMKNEIINLYEEIKTKNIFKRNEDTFIKLNAEIEFRFKKNLKESIKLYKSINENYEILKRLAELLLYDNDIDSAKEIIFKKIRTNNTLKKRYYIKQKKYDKVIEILEKQYESQKISKIDYYEEKVFILLHKKEYKQVIDLVNKNIINKTFKKNIGAIIYNLEYAKKQLGEKINNNKLEEYREKESLNAIEAGYFFLKNDIQKTIEIITKKIENDYSNKFLFASWCYFKDIDHFDFLFENN